MWQSPGRDAALQNPRKILLYLRRVDNLRNNKYNILNSQAMRNKSSAGRHQERKPFGCKVFWINAGSAVLSLTGGNARACAQTLLRYP